MSYIVSVQIKSDIGNHLAQQSFSYADRLDRDMWSRAKEIEVLSRLSIFQQFTDIVQLDSIIQELHAAIPAYAWVGLLDSQGNVVVSSNDLLKGQNIATRPVFSHGLQAPFVGDVHDAVLLANLLPNPTGEAMKFVDISMPVQDAHNNTIGVLATHLSWAWINELESTVLQVARDEQVELFVVSQDGTVLMGQQEYRGLHLELPIIENVKASEPAWMVQRWPDGQDYLTGAAVGDGHLAYAGLGWTVLCRQPLAVAFQRVAHVEYVIIAIGVFCTLLVAAIGAVTAGRVARPLRSLVQTARQLGQGAAVAFPGYVGIVDIEELYAALKNMVQSLTTTKAERDDMKTLAFKDKLTQLPNRRAFEEWVGGMDTHAPRRNQLLAVLFLDLDGFKLVNDTLGHDAGDLVLQAAAIRLKGSLRSGDAVFRLGGDEFVIVAHVEQDAADQEAQALADRVIRAINTPLRIKDAPVHVGCSIGAAFFPQHSPSAEEVVQHADAALYQAKAQGKNRLVLHGRKAA